MRHGRKRGRLGLVQEHRKALLRNLARGVILHQRITTTHVRAKEASRFIDRLVTIAKEKTLHARRNLIEKLGSGSELLAKKLIETIAPKFSDRAGGYTRVIRYKERPGDGAMLSILEFTVPIEVKEKKPKKKKEAKPVVKKKDEKEEVKKPEPKVETQAPKKESAKETVKEESKETPKKGGFLGTLRKFLKGDDEGKKK